MLSPTYAAVVIEVVAVEVGLDVEISPELMLLFPINSCGSST
jgi:hypothetical protein